jgi:hypothetical protein
MLRNVLLALALLALVAINALALGYSPFDAAEVHSAPGPAAAGAPALAAPTAP